MLDVIGAGATASSVQDWCVTMKIDRLVSHDAAQGGCLAPVPRIGQSTGGTSKVPRRRPESWSRQGDLPFQLCDPVDATGHEFAEARHPFPLERCTYLHFRLSLY